MKVVKHENRWVIESNGKHIGKRHKTKKAANIEMQSNKLQLIELAELEAVELAESLLTLEQREIKDLKAMVCDLEKEVATLESKVEDLESDIETIGREKSDLEYSQVSDDALEAIELVTDLKMAKERLQLGVTSEADNIKELESKIMDLHF